MAMVLCVIRLLQASLIAMHVTSCNHVVHARVRVFPCVACTRRQTETEVRMRYPQSCWLIAKVRRASTLRAGGFRHPALACPGDSGPVRFGPLGRSGPIGQPFTGYQPYPLGWWLLSGLSSPHAPSHGANCSILRGIAANWRPGWAGRLQFSGPQCP